MLDVGSLVGGAVLSVAATVALCFIPRFWSGELRAPDDPFAGWLFGVAWWRGMRRAALCTVLAGELLGVAAVLLAFSAQSGAARDAGAAVGGVAFVLIGVVFSIGLFNRPRFLVPPYLRGERGARSPRGRP